MLIGGARYARGDMLIKGAAPCSTQKMKLDARRGRKGSRSTFSPGRTCSAGTSAMPRRPNRLVRG